MYTGCPITWCSKLQTEIALSMTEADYVTLVQAIYKVIPFINLMKDIISTFNVFNPTPKFHS